MQQLNIAFIGGGNMAEALIAGLIKGGHKAQSITVSDSRDERLQALAGSYGVQTDNDNAAVAAAADVVVLAVKPQQMKEVARQVANSAAQATVISIAAGITTASLHQELGASHPAIVRVMPNTPALVGAGMSVLFSKADESHRARAEYVLAASGETAWVAEENLLHAVTAVSGSGPAYFFLLAELMQAAAESMGLPKEMAHKLATQTAMGAGKMLAESGRTAVELRHQVCSPGGTTQAALDEMYERGLPEAVRRGINAAAKRSKELG
jgi:pyrroline-5-carboxylate reductase